MLRWKQRFHYRCFTLIIIIICIIQHVHEEQKQNTYSSEILVKCLPERYSKKKL